MLELIRIFAFYRTTIINKVQTKCFEKMWCAVCTPIFHCILSALVYTAPLVTAIQITAASKVYNQFGHHLVTL